MGIESVRVRYLDASSIVKIYYDEKGSEALRMHFHSSPSFCATSLCVTEALSVIKSKWQYQHISDDLYYSSTRKLLIDVWGNKIQLDEIKLLSIDGIETVEATAKKHSLDWSDALQLETILRGTYSGLVNDSSSVLITADEGLAKAARNEKIRVWNCIKEAKPEWA